MALLSGGSVKLCDEQGVFIGVLMVPSNVGVQLDYIEGRRRTVRVFKRPPMIAAFPILHDEAMLEAMRAEFFLIIPAPRGSFTLAHIAPEEISAELGFAFLPSAEYMRRRAPEKIATREPIEAGPHLTAARDLA